MSLKQALAGEEDLLEVAHCAAHLPRGGAVGEWYGGWLAVTAEVEATWENSHALLVVNSDKPKTVKPRKPPEGVKYVQQRERDTLSRAAAWRRKHRE